jgi:hypothetical protein
VRKLKLGVDYGIAASPTFATFLALAENPNLKITDRSYEDQERITAMAKFVYDLSAWKVFATFTFQFCASVANATKYFQKFHRRNLPNVSCFFAIELHPGGHGGHVHALFDCDRFPRSALWQEWKKRYGINRIEPINGYGAVCDYVSKYVVKDHAWWNFSLSPRAWAQYRKEEISFPLLEERNFGGQASLPGLAPLSATATEQRKHAREQLA